MDAAYKHQHYLANKAKYLARAKARQEANPKCHLASSRKYGQSTKGKQTRKAWYKENNGQINAQRRVKRKSYTRQIFADQIRTLTRNVLRAHGTRKADKTEDIIGCTIEFLKEHLEQQFRPGMTWANRNLWHIDHRIPCAAFDLSDPKQQKACFKYTNLQPLWAMDNLRKGSRYGQNTCA